MLVILAGKTDCGPCKLLKPLFNKVQEHYPNAEFKAYMLDQESPAILEQFNIRTVPTVIVITDDGFKAYTGKEVGTLKRFRAVLDSHNKDS